MEREFSPPPGRRQASPFGNEYGTTWCNESLDGCFSKNSGVFPPNHPIKKIGFWIIFTIHFGEFSPLFLETPRYNPIAAISLFSTGMEHILWIVEWPTSSLAWSNCHFCRMASWPYRKEANGSMQGFLRDDCHQTCRAGFLQVCWILAKYYLLDTSFRMSFFFPKSQFKTHIFMEKRLRFFVLFGTWLRQVFLFFSCEQRPKPSFFAVLQRGLHYPVI